MYCPDTYKRLNDAKVEEYRVLLATELEHNDLPEDEPEDFTQCEFCEDRQATQVIPVYNPADKINGRGQEAYAVYYVCDECADEGRYMEENFYCEKCGELFIYNHSWEVLAVTKGYGTYCQQCALEEFGDEGSLYLCDLLDSLDAGYKKTVSLFQKLDCMPGKQLLWSGEFSEYSDFPGYTSFRQVADAIREKAKEEGVSVGDMVWPIVNGGRQFSVTLEVYY